MTSRAISTPLSVVTVRLQTASEGGDEEEGMNAEKDAANIKEPKMENRVPIGPAKVMHDIYSEQGLTGFWRGMSASNSIRAELL